MPGILVFGADGQVGWELRRSLAAVGIVVPITREQVDLRDTTAVRVAIHRAKPVAIVNAAAYTAVDKAETETELAFAINAAAPAVMAAEAKAAGIPLIHYSSDYVYDGRKAGGYVESDTANPQSVYARSKLAGDEAILASGAQAVILRTSWVYAARGTNFLKTMLRLAQERDTLRVVSDQIGAPTSAELLADVTAQVLQHIYGRKSDDAGTLLAAGAGAGAGADDGAGAGADAGAGAGADAGADADADDGADDGAAGAAGAADAGAAADDDNGLAGGVYHCTAAGETSWHGYAVFLIAEARKLGAELKLAPEHIEAITTEQYPLPAPRPKNSRLDCSKLERAFGLQLPLWQAHVERTLRELLA